MIEVEVRDEIVNCISYFNTCVNQYSKLIHFVEQSYCVEIRVLTGNVRCCNPQNQDILTGLVLSALYLNGYAVRVFYDKNIYYLG